ncbi:methyl-accepting chemotaxis protein [Thermococcus sp. 21S7]|uniref:methyl-accepting chemotaxis protein n=1 Tax=Thermococcus sp. 21S7 TaxID=1638221 RepID=UPI00143CA166|nr:methyl-accepting chemotaxis protein [Thermococcus sp. 21S7]NJE61477.1 methyl-accepting chemotaxis protein [Thermococcus sp. 21S7]
MRVVKASVMWILGLGVPLLAVLGTVYFSPLAGFLLGLMLSLAVSLLSDRELKTVILKCSQALDSLMEGVSPNLEDFDEELRIRFLRLEEMLKIPKAEGSPAWDRMRSELLPSLEDSLELLSRTKELVSSVPTMTVPFDANELLGNFEEERSTTAELGDYIETLTAGIEEMNTQAQALKEYALETATMAEKGKEISDNVALNVANITEVNREMEQAISTLVEQSKRIGEIVGVISSIADQTNLLALNASIEAARSGEYGRGFAVVAENIRELADQAKKSTEQISSLIVNMQRSIDTVVNSIEREFSVTSEIREAVQELIAAFDDIARRANETAGMIKDLSDSIDGQAQSVQMIMDTMDRVYSVQRALQDRLSEMSDSMLEFSRGLDEIENTLTEINELLDRSVSILNRMKGVIP